VPRRAAVIEALFSAVWFSWIPSDAPAWLRAVCLVGAITAIAMLVVAALAGRRRQGSVGRRAVDRRYLAIVGAEAVALAGTVAVVSATAGRDWVAVGVCAVVGVHFVPLARLFPDIGLALLGAATTATAAIALIVGLVSRTSPEAITGPGAGACLLSPPSLRSSRQPGS
jgi:hypothetical protein